MRGPVDELVFYSLKTIVSDADTEVNSFPGFFQKKLRLRIGRGLNAALVLMRTDFMIHPGTC